MTRDELLRLGERGTPEVLRPDALRAALARRPPRRDA
jgi:hypothetical protein